MRTSLLSGGLPNGQKTPRPRATPGVIAILSGQRILSDQAQPSPMEHFYKIQSFLFPEAIAAGTSTHTRNPVTSILGDLQGVGQIVRALLLVLEPHLA